jgi:membrane associated rhomboid family serine protease
MAAAPREMWRERSGLEVSDSGETPASEGAVAASGEVVLELRRSRRVLGILAPHWGALAGVGLTYWMQVAGYLPGPPRLALYLAMLVPVLLLGTLVAMRAATSRAFIRFGDEGVVFPDSVRPWKMHEVLYGEIASYARMHSSRAFRVIFFWKGLFAARAFDRGSFVEPDALERLDLAISRGLERHPERSEILHRGSLFAGFRRVPWLCSGIAVTLVLVFCWQLVGGGANTAVDLLRAGALSPWLTLDQGEWYRLGAAPLLHGGTLHLAVNVFSLLALGMMLEPLLGRWRLAFVVIVSGALAGVASAMTGVAAASLGFSGAIFGMLGVSVVLRLRFRSLTPMGWKTEALVIAMVAASMFADWLTKPAIDHAAHLAGLIVGALLGLSLGSERELRSGVHGPSRVLVVIVAISGLVWLLAAGRAVRYRATHDLARMVRELAQSPTPGRESRKVLYATELARATLDNPHAGVAELARVSEVLSLAVEQGPSLAGPPGVLAALEYVVGNPRGAVKWAREAMTRAEGDVRVEFVAQLALYEWTSSSVRAGLRGADDVGINGAISPTVVDDAPGTGDVLTLSSPVAYTEGLLAHVLVMEGDDLRGLLRLRFGPFRGGKRHFAEGWSEHRGDRELYYHVAYLGELDEPIRPDAWQWSYWPWSRAAVEPLEEHAAALRESAGFL